MSEDVERINQLSHRQFIVWEPLSIVKCGSSIFIAYFQAALNMHSTLSLSLPECFAYGTVQCGTVRYGVCSSCEWLARQFKFASNWISIMCVERNVHKFCLTQDTSVVLCPPPRYTFYQQAGRILWALVIIFMTLKIGMHPTHRSIQQQHQQHPLTTTHNYVLNNAPSSECCRRYAQKLTTGNNNNSGSSNSYWSSATSGKWQAAWSKRHVASGSESDA